MDLDSEGEDDDSDEELDDTDRVVGDDEDHDDGSDDDESDDGNVAAAEDDRNADWDADSMDEDDDSGAEQQHICPDGDADRLFRSARMVVAAVTLLTPTIGGIVDQGTEERGACQRLACRLVSVADLDSASEARPPGFEAVGWARSQPCRQHFGHHQPAPESVGEHTHHARLPSWMEKAVDLGNIDLLAALWTATGVRLSATVEPRVVLHLLSQPGVTEEADEQESHAQRARAVAVSKLALCGLNAERSFERQQVLRALRRLRRVESNQDASRKLNHQELEGALARVGGCVKE
jgi:hypothetical protein